MIEVSSERTDRNHLQGGEGDEICGSGEWRFVPQPEITEGHKRLIQETVIVHQTEISRVNSDCCGSCSSVQKTEISGGRCRSRK